MTRTLIAALAVSAATGMASAGVALVTETFDYPDGNLAGNGGWTVHSGAGGTPVVVASGAAVLNQGPLTREDVNVPTTTTLGAGQTVYAGFDFSNTNNNLAVYFAHFQSNSSTFTARAFIAPPTAGGDYTIGLSDTATVGPTWASDLTYGQTYRAVISYEFDTRTSRLWINPVAEGDTSLSAVGTTARAVNAFALRQAGSDTINSIQTIDNLIIGDSFAAVVPAPGAIALLGLGGLAAARRRRA
jgi:hypothetical protein